MYKISFFLLFFLVLLVSGEQGNATVSNQTNGTNSSASNVVISDTSGGNGNGSCNGPFYSSSRFQGWGLNRPAYLSTAAISTNLTYCKTFNNQSSCCDSTTDQQISEYYKQYKTGLANMTGDRIRNMKTQFDQFKNLSVDSSLTNITEFNDTLKGIVDNIKSRWIVVNQEIVSCAKAALKLSIGLLCQGCSTDYNNTQQNGTIVLKKSACVALAQSCFKLVQSFNDTKNASRDDFMNLTDAITTFVGDTVAANTSQNSSDSTVLFGDLSSINLTANVSARLLEDNMTENETNNTQNNTNNDENNTDHNDHNDTNHTENHTEGENNTNGGGMDDNHDHEMMSKDMQMEDIQQVTNETMNLLLRAFPELRPENFTICDKNNTSDICKNHPLILRMENHTEAQRIFELFNNKSQWGFIPVLVHLTIRGTGDEQQQNGTQGGKQNGTNAGGNSTNGSNNTRRFLETTGNDLSTNYTNFTIGNNNSQPNFDLNFFFTHMKPNMDMIKFLLAPEISLKQKIGKMMEIQKTIQQELKQFVMFMNASNKLGGNKSIVDQNTLRDGFKDKDILGCVFKEVEQVFKRVNKSIFRDSCDFNMTFSNESQSINACDSNITNEDVKAQLKLCSKQADYILGISGTCENQTCVICVNEMCFTQTFKFDQINNSAKLNYTKDQGREQFEKDDRVSLKTGKRIPDFINIPDLSFMTSFNYTPPCNNVAECSQWFCTKFLRGPVAKIEKVYNPQDIDDELDNTTKALYSNEKNNNSHRLLQTTTSSDVTISENAGVDFNTIAEDSGFNTSITIDGVSTSADSYTNTTDSNSTTNNTSTNTGSTFGNRHVLSLLGLILSIIGLVAFY